MADIGAGAGFPGLALAAALPTCTVHLVEAARRKCEVIDRLAAAAGIENAETVPSRAEGWATEADRDAYEAVTARAVGPLALLTEYAAPLLAEGGILVAWKGRRGVDEERAGRAAAERLGMSAEAVLRVTPFAGAVNRHLHVYRKVAPTPAGFPRRPGMARKRPLG